MRSLLKNAGFYLNRIGVLLLIRLGFLIGLALLTHSAEFTSDMKYFPYYMVTHFFPFYDPAVSLFPGGYGDWAPLSFAFIKLFTLPFIYVPNNFILLRLAFIGQELLVFTLWLVYLRNSSFPRAMIDRFCLLWLLTPALLLTGAIWGQEEFISSLFISLALMCALKNRYFAASLVVGLGFLTAKVWLALIWPVLLLYDPKKTRHFVLIGVVGLFQSLHMLLTFRAHGFVPLIQYGNRIKDLALESSLPSLINRLWPLFDLKALLLMSQLFTFGGIICLAYYLNKRLRSNNLALLFIVIYLYFYLAFYLVTADYLAWILPVLFYEISRKLAGARYIIALSATAVVSSLPWLFKLFYSNSFSISENGRAYIGWLSYQASVALATGTLILYLAAVIAALIGLIYNEKRAAERNITEQSHG